MKNLPVINFDTVNREQLMARINLSNRPSLSSDYRTLNGIAAKLAESSFSRERFVQNPKVYLQEQLGRSYACHLMNSAPASTTELCTTVAVCNVAVLLTILASTVTVAVSAATAYSVAVAWTSVKVNGYYVENRHPASGGFGYTNVV